MKRTLLIPMALLAMGAFAQDYPSDPDFTPDDAAMAKATAACGPDNVKFNVKTAASPQPTPAVEDGKALVYIIEQDGGCGDCDALTKTALDGSWMGANQGYSHFSFDVAPGEHHLCTKWQSIFSRLNQLAALTSFTAEAGKTYYFRMRVSYRRTRAFADGLDLELINADQGRLLVASYPRCTSHAKTKGPRASGSGSGPRTASLTVHPQEAK